MKMLTIKTDRKIRINKKNRINYKIKKINMIRKNKERMTNTNKTDLVLDRRIKKENEMLFLQCIQKKKNTHILINFKCLYEFYIYFTNISI